jgi:hypothetical protein
MLASGHTIAPTDVRARAAARYADAATPRPVDALAEKSERLRRAARQPLGELVESLGATRAGLTEAQAEERLRTGGANEVAHERPPAWYRQLFWAFKNPFNAVLAALAVIEIASSPDDVRGPAIIGVMIAISVGIRFVQELRSGRAAEQLKALVRTTATVLRRSDGGGAATAREVSVRELVPGDVVSLAAGDMIPADVRLLASKDLFVNQAVLTGEAMPVEKSASGEEGDRPVPTQEIANVALMGTNVVSGTATALVVATGRSTYFGSIASGILGRRALTSFDVGVSKITWMLIRFIGVMAPVVLLLNGFTKHDWKEASLFAISVAVGLVPEMLALVVTANLARGALVMSSKKVVVKRLNAIQSFGDVPTLLGRAVDAVQPAAHDARIEVRVAVDAEAPRAVWADPARIAVVLSNVLGNALKYTPAGGTIEVGAGAGEGGRVRIAVTDSGPGVPAELRERVFDKFFRVEHHRQDAEEGVRGSGIGLYVAREIVEAHGGTIECTSGPEGRGARFTVQLPVVPPGSNETT